MKWISLLLIALAVSACSSPKPKPEKPYTPESASRELERGMKNLDEQRYGEAITIFDKMLVQHPATEYDLVVLFNSAVAYEGLGECKEANERYRKVVRSSGGKFLTIEGQAMFRVSLTYECMGMDTKTITSLLDTLRRAANLQPEILKAEIPARLAAAYARLGNRAKALEYFNLASRGLKQIISNRNNRKELLGQTMYLMGKLSEAQRTATMDPVAYAQSLYIQQPYLLQAMEVGHPTWSKKASEDMILAYENIWRIPLTDENRSDFYLRTMQNIYELKKLRLATESDLVEETYGKLGKLESRLQSELAKTSESTKLTEEAKKRDGLKRDGKVVGPATVLEKNSKKRR